MEHAFSSVHSHLVSAYRNPLMPPTADNKAPTFPLATNDTDTDKENPQDHDHDHDHEETQPDASAIASDSNRPARKRAAMKKGMVEQIKTGQQGSSSTGRGGGSD